MAAPKKEPPTLQTIEAKKLLYYAKRNELEQAIGPQGMADRNSGRQQRGDPMVMGSSEAYDEDESIYA